MTTSPIVEFHSSYLPNHPHASNGTSGAAEARGLTNQKRAASSDSAPTITFGTTSSYTLMYNDKGSGANLDGAFYRPTATDGFYILGDYAQGNYQPPSFPSITIKVTNDDPTNPVLAPPLTYIQVWNDKGSGADMDGSIWMPVPPSGYVALGAVSQNGYNQPDVPQLRCMRFDLVTAAEFGQLIWNDKGSGANEDVEIYSIVGLTTFYAQGNYNAPTGPVWIPKALL